MINKFISCPILVLMIILNLEAQEAPTQNDYVLTDDKIKLQTKKSGKGPIAIFIHGGPGAWSKSFEDLKGKNLEKCLSIIYYDQRGCGRSEDSKNDDYSLERMLKDLDLVRQKYNAAKIYLIAHSFGGILAVNYARNYPSHVKGLIFANSTLNLPYSIQNQIDYMNSRLKTDYTASDSSQLFSTFKKVQSEFIEEGLIYKLLSDNKHNVDLLNKIDRRNTSNFVFAKKALYIDDYLKDYTKITNEINIPVLVITGTKDHAIGEEHFKSFDFPNETIKEINGGHLLYYENNKEFVTSIFEFVEDIEAK